MLLVFQVVLLPFINIFSLQSHDKLSHFPPGAGTTCKNKVTFKNIFLLQTPLINTSSTTSLYPVNFFPSKFDAFNALALTGVTMSFFLNIFTLIFSEFNSSISGFCSGIFNTSGTDI